MSNLILITTDQQRFDSLGCNGSDFLHMPFLDALAAQGARFERAYCANPVCTPSRVSLMTGQLPSRHGSYNIGTEACRTDRFLSAVLTGAGYRTHQLGKAHFYPWDVESIESTAGGIEPLRGFAGFETAEISVGHASWGVSGHYETWLNQKGIYKGRNMPQLQVKWLFGDRDEDSGGSRIRDAYQTGDWGMPAACHSGAWILDRTEAFLKDRPRERPFYLNIGFQDPHHPLVVPEDWPKIPEDRIPGPQGGYDPRVGQLAALAKGRIEEEYGGRFGIAGNQDTAWKDTEQAVIKKARSYYYSMVELFDSQMGRLTALLKKYGVFEDTILIVTSDHGDLLFDHGLGEKGPMAFEEVLRVPLLIVWPAGIAPCTVDEPVSLTDIYPTVLDYLGIPVPAPCDGLSLRPLLAGAPFARGGVTIEFKEESDAIRYRCFLTKEWKLVEYMGERFGELYHLKEDPKETENLYFDPAYLPVKYGLLKEMLYESERHDFLADRPSRC